MHYQTLKSRILTAGKSALSFLQNKSSDLYNYALDKLATEINSITSSLINNSNVKFDAALIGGALGGGISSAVTLALSTSFEIGVFYTLSAGGYAGYAGYGGGMNYSIGTW
ncbi:hypothetical protein [uncultured Shewanella sp.]|uniref:hypothetical protein n=1 Tax=uncultured Shewanella sp. TaxID=173975 RepID=UPI002619DA89|nr:hypothetical protein [uncultured Shewanella sp.]